MSPRLLWFFLGAGVGAWWATEKKMKMKVDCQAHHTVAAPPFLSGPNQSSPMYVSQPGHPARNYDWEQERARIRDFSLTAGDTVAELSEATLDTILQATEALKAKMAEHRALREAERRMEEERCMNPPRFV